MSKEKILELSIPEPCTENWDAMQPRGCGRFCDQCSKTVIDFSDASDEDIVRFFSGKPAHICGRFREDQLNRGIPFREAQEHALFRRRLTRFAASLLLVQASAATLQAQERQKQQVILKGRITDHLSQQPLIGMTISVKGLSYPKYSDKQGEFSFVLPASYAGQTVTVKATYQPGSSPEVPGFVIREEEVLIATDSPQTVHLQRYPFRQLEAVPIEAKVATITKVMYLGGAAADVRPVIRKSSLWQKVKSTFRNKKPGDESSN